MRFVVLLALLVLASTTIACDSGSSPAATATLAASPTVAISPTPEPSPTPQPVRLDIQATRLVIPRVSLDAAVGESREIPYVDQPLPGCPPGRPADTTFTVPNQGIVTPNQPVDGFENKAWIFGHSRYANVPGILFALQDLNVGDELFLDGRDRAGGGAVSAKRFVVDAIYIADTDSGGELIQGSGPEDVPPEPVVILQTSVRESGAGKQWLLDQPKLLSKATNVVQGDLNDPCKYLLLFVYAVAAG